MNSLLVSFYAGFYVGMLCMACAAWLAYPED